MCVIHELDLLKKTNHIKINFFAMYIRIKPLELNSFR
jgi:hypothetical protein